MQPQPPININYLEVLKRRKWSLILPAVLVFFLAVLIALILPPVYKSSSTILIEQQEIPVDFVSATVTSFAEQRLQTINARIMSTTRLLEIINQMNLYKDLRNKLTTEEIVGKMREDVKMAPISVEVVDQRTGRPTMATIAFTLSYEGKDSPDIIQKVTNLLVSLFLEENLKVRERQTTETYEFLEEEAARVKGELDKLSETLAAFKKEHMNELPEFLQVNLNNVEQTERNIQGLKIQLQSLKQREDDLMGELAVIQPKLAEEEDKNRLKNLKDTLTSLKTFYSDEYPDVIKLKAQIKALEDRQENEEKTDDKNDERPDNPAYITIDSQLQRTRNEIEITEKQISELSKKRDTYQNRILATAKIQAQYENLVGERDASQLKYNDLLRKSMEAKVAQGLEREQKGERFTLMDPASFPEKPFKPNRLAIMLIGIVLGIGAGVGLAALKEVMDTTVKDAHGLAMAAPLPILAEIPDIITAAEKKAVRRRRLMLTGSMLIILFGGIIIFHFFIMDLSVFKAKAQRRINNSFSTMM